MNSKTSTKDQVTTRKKLVICDKCHGVGSFEKYNADSEESETEFCRDCIGLGIQLRVKTEQRRAMSLTELKEFRKVETVS